MSTTATDTASWTIRRLLAWTVDHFTQHGLEEPRLCGELLLAHALQRRRIELYTRFDEVVSSEGRDRYRELVRRAASREPVAYLVGEKEFFSLPFFVTPSVLIPRPETELLVELAVDHCKRCSLEQPRILDLGTGSGCLAVTLALHIPKAEVVASDVSEAAIDVARKNAARHGVETRVRLIVADGFDLPDGIVPEKGFDVLLFNPPYVSSERYEQLDAMIRDFEPAIAVTDGADGLTMYRLIGEKANRVLSENGVVMVEVGDGQANDASTAITSCGQLVHVSTFKDRGTDTERAIVFAHRTSTRG
ncbi:MAG: peptide chain release factor N(5)-glutamine methyltransferase [Planctomycetota bacterium]